MSDEKDTKIEPVAPVAGKIVLDHNAILVLCPVHKEKSVMASTVGQVFEEDKMLLVEKGKAACKFCAAKKGPEIFWPEIQVNVFE